MKKILLTTFLFTSCLYSSQQDDASVNRTNLKDVKKCHNAECEFTYAEASELQVHLRTCKNEDDTKGSVNNFLKNYAHKKTGPLTNPVFNPQTGGMFKSHIASLAFNSIERAQKDEGEKFKCNECDYSSDYRQHIKCHMPVHTKETPYKCTYPDCNKSYTSQSNLTIHLCSHTGIKPFECFHCNKTFNCSSTLKSHSLALHGDTKPYKCTYPGCAHGYKILSELKAHGKFIHNDQSSQKRLASEAFDQEENKE